MKLEDNIGYAVDGGIDIVQLREKDLPFDELLALAIRIRRITDGKAQFIVNQNIRVAIESNADGVHLPQDHISVIAARTLVPDDFIIGKSAHDIESAISACNEDVDYIILGTIFPTNSKPDVTVGGLNRISEVANEVDCPILGIGGITRHNLASVIAAGANGAAISSAILTSSNPQKEVIRLKALISAKFETKNNQTEW